MMARRSAKNDAPQPMLAALQGLRDCDSRLRIQCRNFLKADLACLRNGADIREAFGGLNACMQTLGPLSRDYQRTLELMRKNLEGFARHHDRAKSNLITRQVRDLAEQVRKRVPQGDGFANSLQDLFDTLLGHY